MKKLLTTALVLFFGLSGARAHYLWISIDSKQDPRQANLVFEGGIRPGDGQYIDRFIARGTTWIQDGKGVRELKMTETEAKKLRWLSAKIEESAPLSLASYGRFGVYRFGETDVQLHYYAKHIELNGVGDLKALARSEKLDLDIVPSQDADGVVTLKVLWKGKPAAGKKVTVRGPAKHDLETGDDGAVSFKPEKPGLYSFLGRLDLDEGGTDPADGKKFSEIRHQSTLTLQLPIAESETAQKTGEEEGFDPLFNGKDLSGWVVVNTAPSTWSFDENGYLVCSGQPTGEIRTEKMYQNFIMEVEWRHMKPRGNAGIFVWADDITARGQPFHRGVEVQVLENAYGQSKGHTTHGDIFPIHGAKMTPVNGRGGGRAFPTEERSKPSPEWNHYRIECQDGNISLAVNGKVVTQGKEASPRKGYLCIESEGGVVHYRNAKIKALPDTPVDEEHVAIANRGYRCLYTGVDLSGWKPAKGWKSSNWRLTAGKEAEPIETEESFSGDVGFIVDVNLGEESGIPKLSVRGAEIAIDPEDPNLEKTGRWNRIEGTVRGEIISITVNGKPGKDVSGAASKGTIKLIPDGPVQWANPYVRKLDTSE